MVHVVSARLRGRLLLGLLMVVTSARGGEVREIRGRVVDDRGQPVAGAVVCDLGMES